MAVAVAAGASATSAAGTGVVVGSEPARASPLTLPDELCSGSRPSSESTIKGLSKSLVASESPSPLVPAIVIGCKAATIESSSSVPSGDVVSEVEPADVVVSPSRAPVAGSAVGAGGVSTARPIPVDVVT